MTKPGSGRWETIGKGNPPRLSSDPAAPDDPRTALAREARLLADTARTLDEDTARYLVEVLRGLAAEALRRRADHRSVRIAEKRKRLERAVLGQLEASGGEMTVDALRLALCCTSQPVHSALKRLAQKGLVVSRPLDDDEYWGGLWSARPQADDERC